MKTVKKLAFHTITRGGGGYYPLILAFSAALWCGSLVAETKFTWEATTGGDIADGANWNQSGTAPGSANNDQINIRKDQSGPITLSKDLDFSSQYNHSFAFNGELKFDTSATTLTLGRLYLQGNNKTTTFTRGTLNAPTLALEENVNSCYNNTFIVDGSEANFVGGTLLVGSKNKNNKVIVQNGASLSSSWLRVGRDAVLNGDGTVASNNLFRVTGAETTLTATGSLTTGVRQGNWIEILDGAQAQLTDIRLGVWENDNAAPEIPHLYDGDHGMRIAGKGTKVVVDGNRNWGNRVTIGWHSGSNTLEVADGAEFICKTNAFIIGNYLSSVEGTTTVIERIPDYRFAGNLVRVTGEGTKVLLDSEASQCGFFMARGSCDDNQRLEILDGASWESRGEFWMVSGVSNGVYVGKNATFKHSGYTVQMGVGSDCTNAYFTVDGGTYAPTVETCIGGSGHYGKFDVINGGLFAVTNVTIKVGVNGSHNALTIGAGGRLATSNVTLVVSEKECEGNVFAVRDGGKANFWLDKGNHYVAGGGKAKGGTILVSGEGSELDMSYDKLVAVPSAGASGARLIVEDGGTFKVNTVYWGDQGADTNDCTVVVSNGTIVVGSGLNVGGSDYTIPHGCGLSLAGTHPSITGNAVGINRDSYLAFDVPMEGYEEVPIQVKNFYFGTQCETRPLLRVTMSPRNKVARVVLVQAENDITVPDDLQLDLPEGAHFVRKGEAGYDPKQLKVRLPRNGTIIMVK